MAGVVRLNLRRKRVRVAIFRARRLLPLTLVATLSLLLLVAAAAPARSAVVGATLAPASVGLGPAAAPASSSFTFDDEFNGSSIDSTLWNTEVATSGNRFCNDSPDSDTGVWTNISSDPSCHGVLVSPPYASITEGGGVASFAAPPGHAFGYLVAGPPSRHPFLSSGDFVLELRMRYDVSSQDGDGVMVQSTDSADPAGTNSPLTGRILQVWNDPSGVAHVSLFGSDVPVGDASAFHDYRLEYRGGSYSLFADGALVKGPIASAVRPTTIWLGHPDAVWWGSSPWSGFSVDSIRVASVPSASISSPADGGTYAVGQAVPTSFSCSAAVGGPPISSCTDSNGSSSPGQLDTSVAGSHTYTVTATASDGQTGTASIRYTVAPSSSTFDDEFDGSSIDSTLWNTDVATSGNRFCNDSPDSDTGVWTNLSSDSSCHGVLVSPPYASVTEGGGVASFAAAPGHTFGYLVAGPPTRHPFPSAGDFVVELRMRYDVSNQDGDGVMVQATDNADPVGTNSPLTGRILQVWNDPSGVAHASLLGNDTSVANASAFHDYRLEYKGGSYSLFVDGALVKGPIASAMRPTTIWLGHPDAVWWGSSPWSGFSVDFIRVAPLGPGPPSALISSPADGQSYDLGESVATSFSCVEGTGGPGIASCTDSNGASAPGGHLDTSTYGKHTYTVTAVSQDGQQSTATIAYVVPPPTPPPGVVGVLMNNGDYATNNPHVQVEIVWPQGATQVFISNDGGYGPTGNATKFLLEPQIPWTLKETGSDRLPKIVYLRFLGAGNDLLTFTDNIILDEIAPSVHGASLVSGAPLTRASAATAGEPSKLHQYRLMLNATDPIVGVCAVDVSVRRAHGSTTQIANCHRRGILTLSRVISVNAVARPRYVRVRNSAGSWSHWRKIR